MILNAIPEKLKRQSKDDFKGRRFEAWLIVQGVPGIDAGEIYVLPTRFLRAA
ncbi:hypothetical protein J2Z50_006549 [Ensifer mexicanus]|nr:hypothetical protein [Sinorhizobium mexicanum]